MARADRRAMANPRAQQALQRNFQGALDHYGEGRFDEAGVLLRKVLRSIPKDPGALHLMGAIHLQTGRDGDAITVLERAAGIDASNAEIHNNLATAYRRQARAADAVASGERAIVVNPSFAAAHFGLGQAHEELGDVTGAVRERRAILALEPADLAGAYYNLALAYVAAGNPQQARRSILRALEIAPNFEAGLELLLDLRNLGTSSLPDPQTSPNPALRN